MARFLASGFTYSDACRCMDVLNASGIETNITVGRLSVYLESHQYLMAKEICKKYGGYLEPGVTGHQEDISAKCGISDSLITVTNEAMEIMKEHE